jgi:DNA polymerase III sliding clamp (beta) subunit (PCNA family)
VALSKEEEMVQAQQVMEAVIDAAADGFTIGFNLYYLLSFVKAVDSSALQVEMGSAAGLVKLKAAGDTPQVELPMEIVYYLMPMQQRSGQ